MPTGNFRKKISAKPDIGVERGRGLLRINERRLNIGEKKLPINGRTTRLMYSPSPHPVGTGRVDFLAKERRGSVSAMAPPAEMKQRSTERESKRLARLALDERATQKRPTVLGQMKNPGLRPSVNRVQKTDSLITVMYADRLDDSAFEEEKIDDKKIKGKDPLIEFFKKIMRVFTK